MVSHIRFCYMLFCLLTLLSKYRSEKHQQCSSWFRPVVRDVKKGYLHITIENPTSATQDYQQALLCTSLDIVKHDRNKITIPPGSNVVARYKLGIKDSYMKTHPDQFEHSCIYSKWIDDKYWKCEAIIRTLPGKTFLKRCTTYDGNDLALSTTDKTGFGKIISVTHTGPVAQYVANVSCEPDLNLLLHGNMYNSLANNEKWDIPLAPNCSGVLDVDFSGNCKLSIYHMCQERAPVAEFEFPYFEGDVEECQLRKKLIKPVKLTLWDDGIIRGSTLFFMSLIAMVKLTLLVRFLVLVITNGFGHGCTLMKEEVKTALKKFFLPKKATYDRLPTEDILPNEENLTKEDNGLN